MKLALIEREETTSRESLLIFREGEGRSRDDGPMSTAVRIRWRNGLDLDLDVYDAGLDDAVLLARFIDSSPAACERPQGSKDRAIIFQFRSWKQAVAANATRDGFDLWLSNAP